jgi:N-methylhydantoinase A
VERGFDPREFTLFSFGGAGGMHAAYLARLLNMPRVLVPANPGILSALGMLMADVIKDYSHTVMLQAGAVDAADIARHFEPLEERGRRELAAEGVAEQAVELERYLDMRYEGQSFEILTPFEEDYVEAFQLLHERTYGYRYQGKPVQLVNVRLRARGKPKKPEFAGLPQAGPEPAPEALLGSEDVVFEGSGHKTRIIDRQRLAPGNEIAGPAVIVEYTSTVLVPPFAGAWVDEYANLVLEIA